jgi:putative transposase
MQVTRHCAVTYRIYPDKAQAGLIDRTIGCARLVYNLMLETRIDTYNRTGKSCNPTPAQYKDEYPFLREVDSLALCNAQLNVAKAYNNFFRDPKHVGFPKYKAKHRSAWRYTTNNNNRNIRLIEGGRYLKLPKVGVMRARQHKTIPDD